MPTPVYDRVKSIEYWQDRLFINVIIYALPLSLLALIPSVYIEYKAGETSLIILDLLALLAVTFVALKKGISLHTRKVIIVVVMLVFTVVVTAMIGAFTMGCIYLFALSVFVALQFPDRAAYGMVIFNVLFCAGFEMVIRYRLMNIPLIQHITADRWLIFSVNFIFMDMVVVGLIRQILNGLQHTIHKEGWLHSELRKEMAHKASLNDDLKNSEEDHRTLFYKSPLSKVILDTDTLQILQVNYAATLIYGYTQQEFTRLKLTDIYDVNEVERMLSHMHEAEQSEPYRSQHIDKDGRTIHTEILHSNMTYQGRKARMIVVSDITQRVQHLAAIQAQNDKLREIAYMQSHVIRLPLARIMSLTELMDIEYDGKFDRQLLDHLVTSANELDQVVREVVNRSAEILADQHAAR
ncbi:PAS domain S-box protein [Mucilaginibacter daejeonensis]|uniref:PAS domain S-box protein n=1 Tax=Mucilaginibacter daejeonensis TaxID=398049 RepID=UPI001D17A2EA|nr:PAS domain S-box protein [Mucilaginibacter daejeonensis]UEG54374.1 PAS domain S-box protein [Mucilaginibacter daejeonensis]